jgi:hypothetical protein
MWFLQAFGSLPSYGHTFPAVPETIRYWRSMSPTIILVLFCRDGLAQWSIFERGTDKIRLLSLYCFQQPGLSPEILERRFAITLPFLIPGGV